MADRFDLFSETARDALTRAQEEAQRQDHNHISTGHMLSGLLRAGGAAATALANIGVDADALLALSRASTAKRREAREREVGLTPAAQRVTVQAVAEARRMNHSYVGTEHLLLGLAAEASGEAHDVLAEAGVTADDVRAVLQRVVAAEPAASPPSSAEQTGRRFTLFTEEARDALTRAQEESQRHGHNYIATAHLLGGLLRAGGPAATVLANLGIDAGALLGRAREDLAAGLESPGREIGLTTAAKRVIEQAVAEARRMDHSHIGTEHLLLGLAAGDATLAARLLAEAGADLERLRAETRRVLDEG